MYGSAVNQHELAKPQSQQTSFLCITLVLLFFFATPTINVFIVGCEVKSI